jgi:hypothetical protein
VVRIHDLGPMRVDINGVPRPAGGGRLESVLAALVVHLGQRVTADWLAEAIWGPQPARDPSGSLDTNSPRSPPTAGSGWPMIRTCGRLPCSPSFPPWASATPGQRFTTRWSATASRCTRAPTGTRQA